MHAGRVLSVGQCGYDHAQIVRHLGRHFGMEVIAAHSHEQALESLRAGAYDLVLVNRVGDRDGAPGIELIRRLKADPETTSVPVMLVSNYADAQNEAVALGALPGFGKSDLGRGRIAALERALAEPASE